MKKINACGNFQSASKILNVSSNTTNVLQIISNYSGQEKMRCISDSISFGLNSASSEITNGRLWFGDGSSYAGLEVKRPFANVGTYQVLAINTELCGNALEAAYSIDISNSVVPPSVNYWFQPLAQCVNQGFIFDNLTDNATKMVWDFGDGVIEEQTLFLPHVFHAYNKAGYYNAVLTASNGCGSTVSKSRSTVIAAPTIQFDVSKSSIYKSDTVYFNNRTKGYSDFVWYFNYDENDTSTNSNPYKVYNQAGTFPVSMIAFNEFGCWDTVTKYINVSTMGIQDKNGINQMTMYPNPANNQLFIAISNAFIQENLTIQIIDLNGRILINQKFDNPTGTKQVDIYHIPNGTYLLSVNNGKEIMHGKFIVIH
jgi:PKD repeat protein